MSEMKKTMIILGVIIAIVLIVPFVYYANYTKGEKIVKAVDQMFEAEEVNLVFVGRPTCSYCQMLQPILDGYVEDYEFTYSYVNTDKLNSDQVERVITKFGLDMNNFGTPYMAVVDNGEVVDEQQGYVEAEELFEFLQNNGFIAEDEEFPVPETDLTVIDYEGYNDILNGDTKEIIVIAQTGCSACESAKPVLDEIAGEYEIKINWFDVIKIDSEEDYDAFMTSLDYLEEEQWGTPLTLIVENGELVDVSEGFYNKETYVDFFKENGYIE